MNERIKQLIEEATRKYDRLGNEIPFAQPDLELLAKLIVEATLDEVKERAYYTGDRDWSDEVDRPWIQLEFGYGPLHDAKTSRG